MESTLDKYQAALHDECVKRGWQPSDANKKRVIGEVLQLTFSENIYDPVKEPHMHLLYRIMRTSEIV